MPTPSWLRCKDAFYDDDPHHSKLWWVRLPLRIRAITAVVATLKLAGVLDIAVYAGPVRLPSPTQPASVDELFEKISQHALRGNGNSRSDTASSSSVGSAGSDDAGAVLAEGELCSDHYGERMLEAWRAAGVDVFGNTKTSSTTTGSSSASAVKDGVDVTQQHIGAAAGIRCFSRPLWSSPRNVCLGTNGRLRPLWGNQKAKAQANGPAGTSWLSRAGGPAVFTVLDEDDATASAVLSGGVDRINDETLFIRNRTALDRVLRGRPCKPASKWELNWDDCRGSAAIERTLFFGDTNLPPLVPDEEDFTRGEIRITTTTSTTVPPSGELPLPPIKQFVEMMLDRGSSVRGKGADVGGGEKDKQQQWQCTRRVKRALIQVPWDLRNFYEWLGDWVQLVETLLLLKWRPSEVELFLVVGPQWRPWYDAALGGGEDEDLHDKQQVDSTAPVDERERQSPTINPSSPQSAASAKTPKPRPFNRLWRQLFPKVHVGTVQELFGSAGSSEGKGSSSSVCFDEVATVAYGGLTTFSANGGRQGESQPQCAAPTVQIASLLLEGLVGMEEQKKTSEKTSEEVVETSKEDPSSTGTSSSEGALVLDSVWPVAVLNSSTRSMTSKTPPLLPPLFHVTVLLREHNPLDGRHFTNDTLALETVLHAIPPHLRDRWRVHSLVLKGDTPLAVQLDIMRRSNVLVSAHGAGLTLSLFLPPSARVVEVSCGNKGLQHMGAMNFSEKNPSKLDPLGHLPYEQ